jgi:hypothetical protein
VIIWRGWGFLAAIFLFGGLLVTQLVVDGVSGQRTYSNNSAVFGGVGAMVGGAVTYAVARWLERRNPPRQLVDPATGEEVRLQSRDDLFFIPMKVWGLIGIVGGAIIALGGLLGIQI